MVNTRVVFIFLSFFAFFVMKAGPEMALPMILSFKQHIKGIAYTMR